MDRPSLDSTSVYHDSAEDEGAVPEGRVRAFYLDVYDDDRDDYVHAWFGAVLSDGSGIARGMDGTGLYSFIDIERFADRQDGEIVWF
ncbi:hypothetical protein [Salinactinospora qingdaonensis]|uniref:Uncharacterized protein n=1 Tax=Salinactinospora qingdaonensis TaxID=702744 RepID=A0ABP7FW73_9ACTN